MGGIWALSCTLVVTVVPICITPFVRSILISFTGAVIIAVFTVEPLAGGGRAASSSALGVGDALLGILPGSRRGNKPPRGQSAATSARHQEKKQGPNPNLTERTAENLGEGDSMIALSNFGQRPRFPGGEGRRAHAGEFARARSDSRSGTTTEPSEAHSRRTGGTANLSTSTLSCGYTNLTANDAPKPPRKPYNGDQ
jgi:hypothetical protein